MPTRAPDRTYRVLKTVTQYSGEWVVEGENPIVRFKQGYVFVVRDTGGWDHARGPRFSIMANPRDDSARTSMFRRELETLERSGVIEEILTADTAQVA